MATAPSYPSLLQINTRVWLERLSREAGRRITLADIDDKTIDGFAAQGFDWIWLLSVWWTGAAGRAVSRSNPQWRAEFMTVLPDLTNDDICGSGFAITAYAVSEALGDESGLAQFRESLARRGVKLMLDFVPNHTAPDHAWVRTHPDYYVQGDETALARAPHNYVRVETDKGRKVLAYGRDPNYPGWPDTLQLNYADRELQAARIAELIGIAGKCDGVRCDMAMLLLPEVFQRTWDLTPEPFWPRATAAVREAGLDYQDKLARFLENHDEPRAAVEFSWPRHAAAAIITVLSPGLRFFYQGQLEGAQVRVPTHLCRGPVEPINDEIASFYGKLLGVLKETSIFRDGAWSLIEPQPAWSGNWTSDGFVAYAWAEKGGGRYLVVVNYAGNQGQCRLPLPFSEFRGKQVRLTDAMGTEQYNRDGDDLVDSGLYIDHSPWRFNVFQLQAD